MGSLTANLVAPKTTKEFTAEWARRILVDYTQKQDPDWLLGGVLKVIDVMCRENPHPGMLSNSYVAEVYYKLNPDEEELNVESWFIKIPQSELTSHVDEIEAFMYQKMFVCLQDFADRNSKIKNEIQMPIPIIFHSYFSEFNRAKNQLVMENLRDQGYKPLRPETCGLVFMRAAITSLATFHATAFAYQHRLGGKQQFLERYPLIKEDNLPPVKLMKDTIGRLLAPYLAYMSRVQPDVAPQLGFLTKFSQFLLPIFAEISRNKELQAMKIMVHGDSKIDNFLFRKVAYSEEDTYSSVIVDWQGVCYDFLSSDLMWTLYGFLKNLPDKNATVDSFVDYSIGYYHTELIRLLKNLRVEPEDLKLPLDEYDICTLSHKGFVHSFLKVVLVKPLLTVKDPDLLTRWYESLSAGEGTEPLPLPSESEIFKTGASFVNFIHLYIVIATEIGVFHDLGPMCITLYKEVMFSGKEVLDKILDADDNEENEISKEEQDELNAILNEGSQQGDENGTAKSCEQTAEASPSTTENTEKEEKSLEAEISQSAKEGTGAECDDTSAVQPAPSEPFSEPVSHELAEKTKTENESGSHGNSDKTSNGAQDHLQDTDKEPDKSVTKISGQNGEEMSQHAAKPEVKEDTMTERVKSPPPPIPKSPPPPLPGATENSTRKSESENNNGSDKENNALPTEASAKPGQKAKSVASEVPSGGKTRKRSSGKRGRVRQATGGSTTSSTVKWGVGNNSQQVKAIEDKIKSSKKT